jgi:hypothetical protein
MQEDYPIVNESRYDVVLLLLAAAKGKPEDALNWAMKISTETTKLKHLSVTALHAVLLLLAPMVILTMATVRHWRCTIG